MVHRSSNKILKFIVGTPGYWAWIADGKIQVQSHMSLYSHELQGKGIIPLTPSPNFLENIDPLGFLKDDLTNFLD